MKLHRQLGLTDVFCISAGAMISSGIFILPGPAFAQTGPSVFLSYILAGILALTGAITIAELATAMPKAGGDYFYISRSMGAAAGTISGIGSWLALTLKSAFAVYGISAVLAQIPGVPQFLSGVVVTALFVLLNTVGVKEAGRLEVYLVAVLLVLMSLFVIRGMPAVRIPHFEPFAPEGQGAILITTGFVFVSYGGVLQISSVSEEVREPSRTIPLALVGSVLVVTILYALMLIATVGILEADVLRESVTPIADAARTIAGPVGYWAILAASLMAFVTTANAGVMAASRYPLALGRDGLFPPVFGRVNARFGTPLPALILTGGVICASLLLPLVSLVKAASTVVLLGFVLAHLSVIILRESRIQNYRPTFRSPLYPWIQYVGIVTFSALILDMGLQAIAIFAGLLALGFLTYLLYGRREAETEFALLHLLNRIVDRRLTREGPSLETELKEILYERDDITKDRFDHLIEDAPALDLPETMDLDEFFDVVSEALEGFGGLDRSALKKLLEERETDTSTAISSFVAIPHLVLEGTQRFNLALIRARNGIHFSDECPAVRAVFVLAGTLDERNLHLKALAAIAQIAQDPAFEQRWLAARDDKALRDVILLGKRTRAS